MPATDARHVKQSGFGLVEILIALALGVVIVLGITQLFTTGSRTMSDLEETGRRIENSVFAAEYWRTTSAWWGIGAKQPHPSNCSHP